MFIYSKCTQHGTRAMSTILTICLVAGLALSTSALQAKQKPVDNESWDEWKGLGKGFAGRRKVPPNFHLKASKRSLKSTQKRGKKGRKNAKNRKRQSINQSINQGFNAAAINSLDTIDQTVNAVWLNTRAQGLYGVSIDELAVALEKPAKTVRKKAEKGELVLRNAGLPLSWHLDGETVLFAAKAYDTFYSDTNATRLKLGGKNSLRKGKALPMEVVNDAPSSLSGVATPFMETLKFEEEPDFLFSVSSTASDPDADYWYWNYLFGGHQEQLNIPLTIPSPVGYGPAEIRVTLRGSSSLYAGDEHQVSAELNGFSLGSLTWDNFEERDLELSFDQSLLDPSGNNTLTLSSSAIAGAYAVQFLDQVEIDYARLPVAVDDILWLHDAAAGSQSVSGFSSADIFVIESPLGKAIIRNDINIVSDGYGGWAVNFETSPGASYLLSGSGSIKTSEQPIQSVSAAETEDTPDPELTLVPDYRSTLKKRKNRANYLIIAPDDFAETATGLQAHRLKRFSNVEIAWLKDIYDEFSDGREDPSAIGEFVTWVEKKWQQPPSFITLIGKGTLDHKNRMGYGDSFLPTTLTGTPWKVAASDDKLLAIGDESRFAVGRIPITSDAQGLAYLAKLAAYENTTPGVERFEAVVVADEVDPDAGDFHANSDLLAERLTDYLGFSSVTKLYHPDNPVHDTLIQSATWETGYVTYDGHGSIDRIGIGIQSLFTSDEAALLENSSYPIFTALTCSSGNDSWPGAGSLTGALVLNPGGGAIVAMAPSGLSLDADAQVLGNAYVDSLYAGNLTIGEAVREAKTLVRGDISEFMPNIYSVIGDPAVYAR